MSISDSPATARKGLRQYDHAAFYPTIRQSDIFLCSYPKSGTTWLGFLIAQAIKPDGAEPLDLKSFNRYVPDVNLLYTKRGSLTAYADFHDPRFFLCHATCDLHLPRVVYVTRDPRDVMVSYWHYRKFLSADFNLSLAEFLRSDDHWPCEWDAHVASWLLPRTHPNLLMVRYEDLHRDAGGVLRNVLNFAGVKPDEARIHAAVEASRFEKMRAAEETHGVHGKAGDPGERFVRKGRVGAWQEEMGEAELRIIEEKYGGVMRQLGYGLANDQ
jgi:hypothetical protein